MTILTEKESVAKNYAKALKARKTEKGLYETDDKKIKITFAAGHLYNLYDAQDYDSAYLSWTQGKLPFIPKEYKTKPIKTKLSFRKECEKHLRQAVQNKDEIIIATDPDREGEVIARFILNKICPSYTNIKRIWNCEGVNDEEIIKGLNERKDYKEFEDLYVKGAAHKKADWVMGINLTRAVTIIKNNGSIYSVGRVQTAVLKELQNREYQIMLFIPKKYYEIKITDEKGNEFYFDKNVNSQKLIETKEEAEKIKENFLPGNFLTISKVEEKEDIQKMPLLYDSAALQIDGFDLFSIDVSNTLEISQKLYNEEGLISYPRTDSRFLKDEDYEDIKNRLINETEKINEIYGLKLTKEEARINIEKNRKRCFDSSKVTGHHAIILSRKEKENGLNENSDRIYDLVRRRFISLILDENKTVKQKVYAALNGKNVYAEGLKIIKEGWKALDLHKKNDKKELDYILNQKTKIVKSEIIEKQTEKPKYYTQSSILSWMKNPNSQDEEKEKLIGIGTQSTQSTIIKTLFERDYIKKEGKHIRVTPKGTELTDFIVSNRELDLNTDVEATTRWEKMNEENPEKFLREIEEATFKSIKNMEDELKTVIERQRAGICPSCGGEILKGKKGWYCSNWKDKDCKNSIYFHVMGCEIDYDYMKKLLETKAGDEKEGRNKEGEVTRFRFVIDNDNHFVLQYLDATEKICACPVCKSDIKAFAKTYKCTNEGCSFFLWKKTSGISFTKEMAKSICEGNEITARAEKKDGSITDVSVKLNDTKDNLVIKYMN